MFEIGIFCVILIAAAYSATLWFMGRKEDVLHGEFVQTEPQPVLPSPQAALPPTPQKLSPQKPALQKPAPQKTLQPSPPQMLQPKTLQQPANPENLQSLLEIIKRDLNDAASA
jgi:type IV secretory pathway VirB10-like protein